MSSRRIRLDALRAAFAVRRLTWRQFLLDLTIGAVLTVYLVAATAAPGVETGWPIWRDIIEGTGTALRRLWTIPATIAVLVVTGFNEVTTWPYPLGLSIVLYTVSSYAYPRMLVWAFAVIGTLLLFWPLPAPDFFSFKVLIYAVPELLLFTVVPVMFGRYALARQGLFDALRERVNLAERQRELVAENARAQERARLANEIHDVVAHRVSLMVVHTGALKLATSDERTREVADLVRDTGRQALDELRELVGVLRSGEDVPLGPTSSLDNLDALIEDSRAAGAEVSLTTTGSRRRLPSTVERTAYRVIQEALTNARKHAPGASVQVELSWHPTGLQIAVRNGPSDQPPQSFPESGHGLAGLRERVALMSGIFESGSQPNGGWLVQAFLPTTGGDE